MNGADLFDLALEQKAIAAAGLDKMRAVLEAYGVERLPVDERHAVELPGLVRAAPLAVVSADVLAIAETYPVNDGPMTTGETTSPLIGHFVYLERDIVVGGEVVHSFAAIPRTAERVLLLPFTAAELVTRVEGDHRVMRGVLALASEFLERDRVGRAQRRRAGRRFPTAAEISTVTTLRLRREQERHHNGDGSPVEWSHRWLVSGHWRRLADRVVWVRQHVKGPDDKPLVVKQRRVRFDR